MITVVNKHWHKTTPNDVFIGRGSVVGNPYTHLDSKFENVTSVASRDEAIQKYKVWFENAYRTNEVVHSFIDRLVVREMTDLDTNLVCYCAPSQCHGDIIKRKVEEIIQKIRELT